MYDVSIHLTLHTFILHTGLYSAPPLWAWRHSGRAVLALFTRLFKHVHALTARRSLTERPGSVFHWQITYNQPIFSLSPLLLLILDTFFFLSGTEYFFVNRTFLQRSSLLFKHVGSSGENILNFQLKWKILSKRTSTAVSIFKWVDLNVHLYQIPNYYTSKHSVVDPAAEENDFWGAKQPV